MCYSLPSCFTLSFIVSFFIIFRRDPEEVMKLLTMTAGDSDFSSDSDEEKELEWLYIQCSFCNKREIGQKFNMDLFQSEV